MGSMLARSIRCSAGSFALALGAVLSTPPAVAQEIVLGHVGPFTSIPARDGVEVNHGIRAYVGQVNRAGGIKGRKIRFFEADDRYSADGFVEEFQNALKQKPIALLSPLGSAAMTRMLNDRLLDGADVLVINAIPGVESVRTPGHAKLFHVRAGDKQQIEKIVHHARTLGMVRLSLLYQDIPMGTSGLAVAQQAASGLEFQSVKSAAEAGQIAAAAQQVARQSPQGVIVVGAPWFSAESVAHLRKAGVTQWIFLLSYVSPSLLVQQAGLAGARGVGIAQTFPNPNGARLPLQAEFRTAMKAAHPQLQEYTPFQLEGYLSARVVGEALKRSRDAEISPASLSRALRSAGEMDFGGFRVNFANGNVGSQFVEIGVINAEGRLVY